MVSLDLEGGERGEDKGGERGTWGRGVTDDRSEELGWRRRGVGADGASATLPPSGGAGLNHL